MARRENTRYELNLLQNGLDFMKSGIETFFMRDRPRPRAHKYALLHMFSGVLLLLRERLARIRPSLVFVDETQVGVAGARTIDYHTTMRRLTDHGVVIDPAARAVLDEIRELRNAIEHYEVKLTIPRTKEIIGELAAFAYVFCSDELHVTLEDHLSRRTFERFYALKSIGDYLYDLMVKTAEADAAADEAYFREIEASFVAMSPDEVRRYADELASQRGFEPRVMECPTCSEVTLFLFGVGVCINTTCRATHRLGRCHYCEEVAFDGAYYCDPCRYGQV